MEIIICQRRNVGTSLYSSGTDESKARDENQLVQIWANVLHQILFTRKRHCFREKELRARCCSPFRVQNSSWAELPTTADDVRGYWDQSWVNCSPPRQEDNQGIAKVRVCNNSNPTQHFHDGEPNSEWNCSRCIFLTSTTFNNVHSHLQKEEKRTKCWLRGWPNIKQ